MDELIERIGICQSKALGYPALFHTVLINQKRKYRVWPVAGREDSLLLSHSEYTEKYQTVEDYPTEENEGTENGK